MPASGVWFCLAVLGGLFLFGLVHGVSAERMFGACLGVVGAVAAGWIWDVLS